MDEGGISARLHEAFARLNQHMDSVENRAVSHQWSGLVVLGGELAQARAMIDIIDTRLATIPAALRADLDPKLGALRARWKDADGAYEQAKELVGHERAHRERDSRAALDEVQDGLLAMVMEMNRRFAGRASELVGEGGHEPR